MRIERIQLKNYRQFRDLELLFKKRSGKDLNIVVANNGTGKTNLLNAINWCLYGTEPHLSKESQQLPRLNLNTLVTANDGSDETVSVELVTETEGNRITFSRSERFSIHAKQPTLKSLAFHVTYLDEKMNAKMVTDEDAASYVARFVPQDLREFFFFDGERLDTYFKSATGAQISHAVFEISNVHTLDRMADRIETIVSDIKKEAGRSNPQLEAIREELETKKKTQKEIQAQIGQAKSQLEEARDRREELIERLKNMPDIAGLENEKAKLEAEIDTTKEMRNQKLKEKRDILFEFGINLKLYPSLKRSAQIIQTKVDNKEIPQTYDTRLLDKITGTHLCICGREVLTGSPEEGQILALRKEIQVSSDVAQELMKMQSPLDHLLRRVLDFKDLVQKINRDISFLDDNLNKSAEKIRQIETQIGGFPNADQIKQWHEDLETYKQLYKINEERTINLKLQDEKLRGEIQIAKEKEEKELRRLVLLKDLRQQISFGTKASETMKLVKEDMMNLMRVQIEAATKEQFFSLVWKKETFKDVTIDEGYSLHLIHTLGYECLGTVSASERQLLALSFVLALHRVSGFDSPILVDSPAGRVSNEQRENLGKAFSAVSNDKQVILLFLPTEYSTDISKILDGSVAAMYVDSQVK